MVTDDVVKIEFQGRDLLVAEFVTLMAINNALNTDSRLILQPAARAFTSKLLMQRMCELRDILEMPA